MKYIRNSWTVTVCLGLLAYMAATGVDALMNIDGRIHGQLGWMIHQVAWVSFGYLIACLPQIRQAYHKWSTGQK